MERVVVRSELYSDNSTPASESPEPEALERLKNLDHLEFKQVIPLDKSAPSHSQDGRAAGGDVDEDEGLDFRLFATPSSAPNAASAQGQPPSTTDAANAAVPIIAQKIRLRSPSIDPATAGFTVPHRPQSHYIISASPHALARSHAQAAATAVSGAQVRALSRIPWTGTACPWRVLRLPASGETRVLRSAAAALPGGFRRVLGDDAAAAAAAEEEVKKRTRRGKKARIRVRVRVAAAEARAVQRKEGEEERERAEREKRNRRNREKKIKRRARERAKKMGLPEGGGEDGSASQDSDGD